MLLFGRAVAPRCLAPEGPAPVAPAGATDRKAVENVYGVTGRKHEVEDPLLDQRQCRALPGEGLVGSKVRKEVPPMPVEVPVDGRVIVTLFTEDLHRQHLDVGQLRFRAALPQSTAERHPPVGVIDLQIQQDERFFQAASRRPHGQTEGEPHPCRKNPRIGYQDTFLWSRFTRLTPKRRPLRRSVPLPSCSRCRASTSCRRSMPPHWPSSCPASTSTPLWISSAATSKP